MKCFIITILGRRSQKKYSSKCSLKTIIVKDASTIIQEQKFCRIIRSCHLYEVLEQQILHQMY